MTCPASGDAWGVGYGHDGVIPPGHYKLTGVDIISPPIASEGGAQIDVADLAVTDALTLITNGAAFGAADAPSIGGVVLGIGGLAQYGRSAIMIHGGGSNAPDPFAAQQMLCKTDGCTRVLNSDLPKLCDIVTKGLANGEMIVFSCIGTPAQVSC